MNSKERSSTMKIADWLQDSSNLLKQANNPTARLDCLVLLSDQLSQDKAWILAHSEQELTKPQTDQLSILLTRRLNNEPLAYIRGHSEFYGRDFIVTKDTLQPRPESETLIHLLNTLAPGLTEKTVLDVGTGSGALAITAKLENPQLKVYGLDISERALEIARRNAKKLNADVKFVRSNLLQNINSCPELIIANLPYVPDLYKVSPPVAFEPKLAIFGGADGLDVYRHMFEQLKQKQCLPKYVLTESLPKQHAALLGVAKEHGFKLQTTDDFVQVYAPIS